MVHPRHLFLFSMINSFFGAARDVLDPILTALGGYQPLASDATGRPASPDHVLANLAKLPKGEDIDHIGSSFVATTNLGFAYVYSFRLLYLLETGHEDPFKGASGSHLAKLYDTLPVPVKEALSEVYSSIGSHDLEMEISLGHGRRTGSQGNTSGPMNLRQQLRQWQSQGMLQDSHRKLVDAGDSSVVNLLIPLRAMLLLDRILAKQIAPRLELDYTTMDQEMSSSTEDPRLEWNGTTASVSLPDKRGRVLRASWDPAVTSVVRIKESEADEWSPGFETPLSTCTFVGLKPDTEYDVQLTHKNSAGESEPAYSKMRTKAEGK